MQTITINTLGCSKNLVDSEIILNQFKKRGYDIKHESDEPADIVIINTCGFIYDAKEESVDTILQAVEAKKQGDINQIYVIGCLSQRYREELKHDIPEVDRFYGVYEMEQLVREITGDKQLQIDSHRSTLTTPPHYAYVKIAEGCSRACSFCSIPVIKGKFHSYDPNQILDQVQELVNNGVQELILIAQDLTYYGKDQTETSRLPELVNTIAQRSNVPRLRLHYLFPEGFPLELLEVINAHSNICNYIDLPVQHISDHMLQLMRRGITKQDTLALIQSIRQTIPDVVIRTTLLVGHPYETEEDFNELYEFVREMRFDKLGVFEYSHEEGTYAGKHYPDNVSEELKQERKETIMALQERISEEQQQARIDNSYSVLIDRHEPPYTVGRTQYDSPEVDGEVLIYDPQQTYQPGNFYSVFITGADEYDLYSE